MKLYGRVYWNAKITINNWKFRKLQLFYGALVLDVIHTHKHKKISTKIKETTIKFMAYICYGYVRKPSTDVVVNGAEQHSSIYE